MRFKLGKSLRKPIWRTALGRMAKEQRVSLSDSELHAMDSFLHAIAEYQTAREKDNEIKASDAAFLKSLGIRP